MFAIYRFFSDYVPDFKEVEVTDPVTGIPSIQRVKLANKFREVHKIEYGPLGGHDKTRVISLVSHLKPKLQIGMDVQPGSAEEMAAAKWEFIRPAYERWLQGQEIRPDGTPFAAWSGVGPEQAESLRRKDIHTVEQLAQLTDTHIQQFGIQGLRVLRDAAKRFVSSTGTTHLENQLAEKDVQIAGLTDQVEEMKRMMAAMQSSLASLHSQPVSHGHSLLDGVIANKDGSGPSVQTQAENDAFGGDGNSDDDVVQPGPDDVPVTTAPRRARR